MENQTTTAIAGAFTPELPELLTLQQASKILKVHPNTLRNWERSGMIPVVRVGPRRDRRFPSHGINKFLPGFGGQQEVDQSQVAVADPTITAELEQGTNVPIQMQSAAGVAEPVVANPAIDGMTTAEEAPHVIVNVPPRQRWSTALLIVVLFVAAAGIFYLLLRGGFQASDGTTGDASSFAIRRNPPQTLFADDFEVYEVGELPRPVWNTIGLWKVENIDGQKVLVGEESTDNPLGILSHVYTGSSGWEDYKAKFDAKVVSGDTVIYALVDYLDENNYYQVAISKEDVRVTLLKEGTEQLLGSTFHSFPTINDWNTFTIDLNGDNIDVLIEGERVLGIDNSDLTSGKVGFAVRDQVVEFDHVQILDSDLNQ